MKVVFSEFFYPCYVEDAAAVEGRMESIVGVIHENVMFFEAEPASEEDILAVHDREQLERVQRKGLYEIASLAAGGAIQTAMIGLKEPAFGLIRPPGHHASSFISWGFCNMVRETCECRGAGYFALLEAATGRRCWATMYRPCSTAWNVGLRPKSRPTTTWDWVFRNPSIQGQPCRKCAVLRLESLDRRENEKDENNRRE